MRSAPRATRVPSPAHESHGGAPPTDRHAVLAALLRLDDRLERAVSAAQGAGWASPLADPYRGLYLAADEVDRSTGRPPGAPAVWATAERHVDLTDGLPPFGWLAERFGLVPFDLDLVVVALAPEVDLRYERLYAYLQDDVTRRRPSVDLALNLVCGSAEERLARRVHLGADAPLVRHELLHLVPDDAAPTRPLLARELKLDDLLVRHLLGDPSVDARLVACAELVHSSVALADLVLPAGLGMAVERLALAATASGQPLRLALDGPPGTGRRLLGEAVARLLALPLLRVDLVAASAAPGGVDGALRLAAREALLRGAGLCVDAADPLPEGALATLRAWLARPDPSPALVVVATREPLGAASPPGAPLHRVHLRLPDAGGRQACWTRSLHDAGLSVAPADVAHLAARFALAPAEIATVVRDAAAALPAARPGIADLVAAVRSRTAADLRALARRLEPLARWEDIVLPEDTLAQLREMCLRVEHRGTVLDRWGFQRRLARGTGVAALFSGPSGTGKTMAAEVLAGALGLDLFAVDLAGVVSKYVGETEKNLDRVFRAAERTDAILLFDEADALFGRRSEVRDSHDRYANLEIAFLLQKMEEYAGVAILATNLRQNLDDSFVRRLACAVHFPFPDQASRARIWARVWPVEVPLAADVDVDWLARSFQLSGGNIKNVALCAAYLAAAEGVAVGMRHLGQAVRREYQKLGKNLAAEEAVPGVSPEPNGRVAVGAGGMA